MSNINVREVIERYVAAIKERISRRVPWFKFNASGPYTNFHEENIDWVVKTVSDHENRITIAEATIDAHTEILENHEGRIETCEHRLDEHDVILANHEERITQAEEDIDDLQERMTNAENTLVNHETRIGGLEGRMTNAETTINQHTTEINSLKTRVTNVEGDIVDIKGDIVDIKGDITTIQGDITNIEGDITNIQGDITNIKGDITNINNQIADLVEVEANPTGTATETLTKLRVDDTIYDIPQGGSVDVPTYSDLYRERGVIMDYDANSVFFTIFDMSTTTGGSSNLIFSEGGTDIITETQFEQLLAHWEFDRTDVGQITQHDPITGRTHITNIVIENVPDLITTEIDFSDQTLPKISNPTPYYNEFPLRYNVNHQFVGPTAEQNSTRGCKFIWDITAFNGTTPNRTLVVLELIPSADHSTYSYTLTKTHIS